METLIADLNALFLLKSLQSWNTAAATFPLVTGASSTSILILQFQTQTKS